MDKIGEEHCSSLSLSSIERLSDGEESFRSDSSRYTMKDLQKQTEKWAACTAEWRERWEKMKGERDTALKKARAYKHKAEKAIKEVQSCQEQNRELETEIKALKEKLKQAQIQGSDTTPLTVHFRRRSEPAPTKASLLSPTLKDEGLGSSAESTSPPPSQLGIGLDFSAFSLESELKLIESIMSINETVGVKEASPPPATRKKEEAIQKSKSLKDLKDDNSFLRYKRNAMHKSSTGTGMDLATRKAIYTAAVQQSERLHPPLSSSSSSSKSQDVQPLPMLSDTPTTNRTRHGRNSVGSSVVTSPPLHRPQSMIATPSSVSTYATRLPLRKP